MEGMATDDLPSAAGRLLVALVVALIFAATFLFENSPERLLVQLVLGALVIDGFRPFLSKLDVGTVRAVSGIAYFIPRLALLAMISGWYVDNLPRLVSTAMSHNGWEFAFGAAHAVVIVLVISLAFLMTLVGIGYAAWGDAFGRKPQGG
jgi:hypothetical protein